jgi:rare lipoprotein A
MRRAVLGSLVAVGCTAAFSAAASAASAPEISSSVWEEGQAQCACVTVNGKELIAFHGPLGGHAAEQRAEDLADKIQSLLEEAKFDADKIVPAKEGEVASIRIDGSASGSIKLDGCAASGDAALEQSLKIVNEIRTACGADPLPSTFLKVAELSDNSAASKAGGKCFSGPASWYGQQFHGRKCADGTRFDMNQLTAAHRSLPLGTKLLVMNRRTGDSCVVKVNDRGPFVGNRVIDLSRGAAQQLKMLSSGVAMVDCIILGSD